MPTKKKEYVKFGTTKIRIPKKMVGFDKQDKLHIYNTITPKRRLSYHNKKAALDITVNNNTKTKINRVPYTTKLIKAIEEKKKRKPRKPRLPPAAALAPPPPPPPPFQPPAPPAPRPPPPVPPRPDNPPYQPPPRPPPFQPPAPPAPRPDIRFQQPNMPDVNQFFQSPAPQLLQSPPVVDAFERLLERQQVQQDQKAQQALDRLLQRQQKEQRIANLFGKVSTNFLEADRQNVKLDIAKAQAQQALDKLLQRQQQAPAAQIINLAIKSRLANKQADKIRKKKKYEQAVAKVGNVNVMFNTPPPAVIRLPYSDINETRRTKKILQTEQKQEEYKTGLNRRLIRDKAATIIQRKYKSSQMFKEPKPVPSVILPTEIQPILSRKTPEEAAAIILKNIRTYKFNKILKKNINKKLQEKILKEIDKPSSSTDIRKQEEEQQKQMNILKKNFNDKRKKQDKEALKNQKDRQKEFPKSFKDQATKDWYIKTVSDEYEVYKLDTYKLYEQLQEVKNKPVNLKNQKKIYDLELEILLIGGEARFWKAEIKRAKDIKI